jgi:WD40 repeat protein
MLFILRNFVCAGSDDGSIFIWNKQTTNIVRVLKGDESIVNCLQPHPSSCYLASSGIEPVIKIWWPKFENDDTNGEEDEHVITDIKKAALDNQSQMHSHPFDYLFMNLNSAQSSKFFFFSYITFSMSSIDFNVCFPIQRLESGRGSVERTANSGMQAKLTRICFLFCKYI